MLFFTYHLQEEGYLGTAAAELDGGELRAELDGGGGAGDEAQQIKLHVIERGPKPSLQNPQRSVNLAIIHQFRSEMSLNTCPSNPKLGYLQ